MYGHGAILSTVRYYPSNVRLRCIIQTYAWKDPFVYATNFYPRYNRDGDDDNEYDDDDDNDDDDDDDDDDDGD